MVIIINPHNRETHEDLLDDSFMVRDRIFNGRLGWNLPTIAGREIDQYDTDDSYYLICYEHHIGVYGGCRLLPTTSSYMLENTFRQIDCGPLPKSNEVWESSRFFIDTDIFDGDDTTVIKKATCELVVGMLEFGFYKNLSNIITLTDIRIERIFRMIGCPLERLSQPVEIGNTMTIAANINIRPDYLINVQKKAGIVGSVLIER